MFLPWAHWGPHWYRLFPAAYVNIAISASKYLSAPTAQNEHVTFKWGKQFSHQLVSCQHRFMNKCVCIMYSRIFQSNWSFLSVSRPLLVSVFATSEHDKNWKIRVISPVEGQNLQMQDGIKGIWSESTSWNVHVFFLNFRQALRSEPSENLWKYVLHPSCGQTLYCRTRIVGFTE